MNVKFYFLDLRSFARNFPHLLIIASYWQDFVAWPLLVAKEIYCYPKKSQDSISREEKKRMDLSSSSNNTEQISREQIYAV